MVNLFSNKYTMLVEETSPLKLRIQYQQPYSLAILFEEDGSVVFADTTVEPSSIVFVNQGMATMIVRTIGGGPQEQMLKKAQPVAVGLTRTLTFEIINPNAKNDESGGKVTITVIPPIGASNPRQN